MICLKVNSYLKWQKEETLLPNTSNVQTHSFVKGLNKDSDFTYLQNGMWTHARNATNNTIEGNQGTISNASSNQLCATSW